MAIPLEMQVKPFPTFRAVEHIHSTLSLWRLAARIAGARWPQPVEEPIMQREQSHLVQLDLAGGCVSNAAKLKRDVHQARQQQNEFVRDVASVAATQSQSQ